MVRRSFEIAAACTTPQERWDVISRQLHKKKDGAAGLLPQLRLCRTACRLLDAQLLSGWTRPADNHGQTPKVNAQIETKCDLELKPWQFLHISSPPSVERCSPHQRTSTGIFSSRKVFKPGQIRSTQKAQIVRQRYFNTKNPPYEPQYSQLLG